MIDHGADFSYIDSTGKTAYERLLKTIELLKAHPVTYKERIDGLQKVAHYINQLMTPPAPPAPWPPALLQAGQEATSAETKKEAEINLQNKIL